jgi:hypothetical protein
VQVPGRVLVLQAGRLFGLVPVDYLDPGEDRLLHVRADEIPVGIHDGLAFLSLGFSLLLLPLFFGGFLFPLHLLA